MSEMRSIVVEYALPESPEKVWRALTEPELLARWLMENDIQPVVGHKFNFRAKPVPGWDGIVYCEVLAAEPYVKLSYSWAGGSSKLEGYGHELNTTVTWTLTRTPDGGTHLQLNHAGFREEDGFAYEAMNGGWRGMVQERIGAVLATV